MLRFVDPEATSSVDVGGVTFTVGHWPPNIGERIAAGIAAARSIEDKASVEFREATLEVYMLMVAWGVRGWTNWDGAPTCRLVEEQIGGRKYQRLDPRLLEGVALSGALEDLALGCLRHCNVSDPEKKRSDEPSGSSGPSQATPAQSAPLAPASPSAQPPGDTTTTASGTSGPAPGPNS